ncbi:hypothetical protein E1301_Tti019371 [Triplophysa tibetana]|uniref:Uncharacterized protein n=1 Tax=Triplophysa tibetana TaxID=1572043 RepID=A0A5A9NFW5_9TELE|nr:hypothetical protein E1301_Tti019371 [Triplophysa tibetana]
MPTTAPLSPREEDRSGHVTLLSLGKTEQMWISRRVRDDYEVTAEIEILQEITFQRHKSQSSIEGKETASRERDEEISKRNALHLMWRFSTTDSARQAAAVFQNHGQRCSAAVRRGGEGVEAGFPSVLDGASLFSSPPPSPADFHQWVITNHIKRNSVALLITACFYSELLQLDNPEDFEHEVALSSNSVPTASIDILESV